MFAVDSICLSTYSNVSCDCWARAWRPNSALFSHNSNWLQPDWIQTHSTSGLYAAQVVFTVRQAPSLYPQASAHPHFSVSHPSASACLSVLLAKCLLAYISRLSWGSCHAVCSSSDLWLLSRHPLSHPPCLTKQSENWLNVLYGPTWLEASRSDWLCTKNLNCNFWQNTLIS